ncbi:MAG: BMP family protein [Thermoleophilia bacterium]|nr:BMP family protein [Thermoleophilia bacterium]
MNKKTLSVTLLALLVVAFMAGCGGDDSSDSGSGSGDSGDFKVAMLTPGPTSDQGYNADAQRSADEIEKQTGAQVELTESVPVANQTDIYRQFASQGYNLVIGWGGQFTDGAVAAADEFPDTQFLVANSNVGNDKNLSSMDTAIEQWQFFAGYVAAKLSKTGTVGWIGGQCFPATAANLHGTEEGAKYADPQVKFLSKFTNDFEDPTKAESAATAMIDQGAGAITGNLNSGWPGVYAAAKTNDVPLVTEWIDNSDQAPEVIASSLLKSQAKFVAQLAKEAQDGKLKGEFHKFKLPEDWGPIVTETDLMPKGLYDEVLKLQDKVASGEIKVKHDETCPQ